MPRCPYEVLQTDKHDNIVCNDMFKLLVWKCYAWSAQQFFQVKDRKGKCRDIHGNWNQYSGHFPLWRLSYSIIPLYSHEVLAERSELPEPLQYSAGRRNAVDNLSAMSPARQLRSRTGSRIEAIWENRTVNGYETRSRRTSCGSEITTVPASRFLLTR